MNAVAAPALAVIGGSGLYAMDGLTNAVEHRVDTPFGEPSDAIVVGELGGVSTAFLARHGRGHRLTPEEVNYRANIYALAALGVRYIVGVSAVGSLREQINPLDVVVPDQYINLAKSRPSTFFGDGAVAHVSLADPVCPLLANVVTQAARKHTDGTDRTVHESGTYVCIEGPQFSTKAESAWYRSMGADVIGMTNQPEATLAREASISYASFTAVTDFDCWHPTEEPVTADVAIARLGENAQLAQKVIADVVAAVASDPFDAPAHSALNAGLVTPVAAMTPEVKERLAAILPRD